MPVTRSHNEGDSSKLIGNTCSQVTEELRSIHFARTDTCIFLQRESEYLLLLSQHYLVTEADLPSNSLCYCFQLQRTKRWVDQSIFKRESIGAALLKESIQRLRVYLPAFEVGQWDSGMRIGMWVNDRSGLQC